MNATDTAAPDLGRVAYVLGIVAAVLLVVPPGLFAAPLVGGAAVVCGGIAVGRVDTGRRDQAIVGLVLGAVAVVVSLTAVVLLRHVIWDALHDVGAL